ncbi:methyl-accepting chemotaxis protein [Poseidonocella sedimentorum]|uniref:Methyl-accepting chemotaxis sensory transducer with Pas/Pac sensor n=1 Tax=Poseidonocella sedimentorum TaxID=871652 RepID=A0A1I6DZ59_9RHOB|nr:methyl-accepting chemotaxis protein [Poseidonocella sedimentorum]SFR10612.1 methyl-accepting chemotaxis sensory transducer with Pas/Pac sensor [Poseidonocella sedimentorum]
MLSKLQNMSIGAKLPIIISLLIVASITGLSYFSYQSMRSTLEEEAGSKLEGIAQLQVQTLEQMLAEIERDIQLQAGSPGVVGAMSAFARAYQWIGDPASELQQIYITDNPNGTDEKAAMTAADNGTFYDAAHRQYHPAFHGLRDAMGYQDIFLIDDEGNIIYSVSKGVDFATNLLSGPWKDTGLADVFRRANQAAPDGGSAFADFAPYGAAADLPASFIARPVFGNDGDRIGVVAFTIPTERLNSAVSSTAGLGESGTAFVIGGDHLYRTDTPKSEVNDALTTRLDADVVNRALAGEQGLGLFNDSWGNEVYGYYAPINFGGVTWGMIVEQSTDELFAAVGKTLRVQMIQGAILLAAAIAIGIVVSRGIAMPLRRLSGSVAEISAGNYDAEVASQDRGDEIGQIASALESFRAVLADAEEDARDAAFKGAAYGASASPMMLTDLEHKVLTVNPAFEKLVETAADDIATKVPGFDPAAIVGHHLDLFKGLFGSSVAALLDPAVLPKHLKIDAGDTSLELFAGLVRGRDGEPIGYALEWSDRTEEIRNETTLEALDKNLCRALICVEGSIKTVNKTFCEAVGMDEGHLLERSATKMVSYDDSEGKQSEMWSDLRSGRSVLGRFAVKSEDGSTRILEGSISPVPNQHGEPSGFILMGGDVTEARAEIEAADERRKAMAADQARVVDGLRVCLERVAEGDLTAMLDTPFPMEYEQLREDFNRAVTRLQDAMQNVVANASQIREEASDISSAVDALSKRTESQAATLQQTAAALDELTASVKSASDGAQQAENVVKDARGNAENSGSVVREAVEAMKEIETSSQEISKITSLIDDIAFQTNLLALNAGVEAARAGDAGRGFAVVASEVRELAQRSQEAASRINNLITASGNHVKRGVSLVDATGKALKGIVESVIDISGHVGQIAQASVEQAGGLQEINSSVNQLDQATQHNAAMAEETTAASQLLAQEATRLTDTTKQFKVGDTAVLASGRSPKVAPAALAPKPAKAAGSPASFDGSAALKTDFDSDWGDF